MILFMKEMISILLFVLPTILAVITPFLRLKKEFVLFVIFYIGSWFAAFWGSSPHPEGPEVMGMALYFYAVNTYFIFAIACRIVFSALKYIIGCYKKDVTEKIPESLG